MVLLKIGAPADDEAIEHAYMPAFVDQPIDKMTSDKTCAASYEIQSFLAGCPILVVPAQHRCPCY